MTRISESMPHRSFVRHVVQIGRYVVLVKRRLKSVLLRAPVPNYCSIVQQSLLAGDNVYGKRHRIYPLLYLVNSIKNFGILEYIFVHYADVKSQKFVLIQHLELTDDNAGNTFVVHSFGINRYCYCVSRAGFIVMILIPASDLLRPILLVVDPYWLKEEYGINHRFDFIFAYNALEHT